MMRALAIAAALAVCVACTDTGEGRAYYEGGDATYDAVKKATEACTAKGGQLQLKPQGDSTHLADYACVGARSN